MEALAKAGGLLMIATAGLQFTLLLYRVTVRRIKAARLDGEFLQLLKDLSANAATSSPTPGESNRPGWQGKRKFEIAWREFECPNGDICSFYLTPCDKKPLPIFRPGRFLTFELNIPGQSDPVMRCYSLSDSPNHRRYYRITVKKVPAPRRRPREPLQACRPIIFMTICASATLSMSWLLRAISTWTRILHARSF